MQESENSQRPSNNKIHFLSDIYSWCVNYIKEPISIVATIIFLIVFYTVIYLFRIPMSSDTRPIFVYLIESILWMFLLLIIIYDFFEYALNISLGELLGQPIIYNLPYSAETIAKEATPSPTTIGTPTYSTAGPTPTPGPKNEVFNIANNLYTYDDAQAVCSAYGAKVATYNQVENAYNDGAEWCNYGWSDGQMAFFPTQKGTWDELQKNPKHKNDCGRPGVNGGYIANPYIKFGVNCYGEKPVPSEKDLTAMNQRHNRVYPKSEEDTVLENKVNYWKQNAAQLLNVNSCIYII